MGYEINSILHSISVHSTDPAVIFAAGVIAGVIIFMLLSKMKKYIILAVTLLMISVFAYYISGKKISDYKSTNKNEIREIGEAAKKNMKTQMKETLPGMNNDSNKNK